MALRIGLREACGAARREELAFDWQLGGWRSLLKCNTGTTFLPGLYYLEQGRARKQASANASTSILTETIEQALGPVTKVGRALQRV
jgi:hypothetical protein